MSPTGDVKYHLGQSGTLESRGPGGELLRTRLSIAPNPSHLEAVDPVVLGMVRAEQGRCGAAGRRKVLGLLLHGDAAVAGGVGWSGLCVCACRMVSWR
jgi:2-oxoglutarate dehydrogenase E1 component